ncbi:MAG TPA: FGGY-family carbohydrate kinase [Desulfosporosinus sp.]|nr:FGGY-family carbohydrate kinase [Desulfosporosinus sp.]
MARATIVGVAFRMYSVFLALQELGGKVDEVFLTGGVSRSPLWVQTVTDLFFNLRSCYHGERLVPSGPGFCCNMRKDKSDHSLLPTS